MTPTHLNRHAGRLFEHGALVMCAVLALPTLARADATATATLPPVAVTGHYGNAVGSSDAASEGVIRAELLKSRPALRPGEVLEFVPGMIVTQHSGDGKANQYFLRGFNLDHGTDFATTVNGVPVNMPSHGHGQGYTDLNFLMPELVQRIGYRKGPYFAENGDFSAAGSADIAYRTQLDAPFAQLSLGERAYRRLLGAGSTTLAGGHTLLGAVELSGNNGPWTVPEHLRRANLLLTASTGTAAEGASASLMAYDAEWTATDQVPERLIDGRVSGAAPFGRFDSLDATSGGRTARHSLSGEWHRRRGDGQTRVSAYAMRYSLALYSNFSYAMERPAQGDQFLQRDARSVYGANASRSIEHAFGDRVARSEFGVQLRHDRARVGLFESAARRVTATTRDDVVRETSLGVYGQTAVQWAPWLRSVAGLRVDHFDFRVEGRSGLGNSAANTGRADALQWSPKLSLVLGPWVETEFFFNVGRGFHSNDARGATAPGYPVPGLAASRGMEIGVRTEWIAGLQSSLALWRLHADSELVYVGDAGTTEASAGSRRRGIEWNNRWIPKPWLLFDADFAWTHARFDDGSRIPNAVDRVASAAATVRDLQGWSASLQWRYLGAGALTEDNSVRSRPSLTINLRVSRRLSKQSELTLDVFNLADRRVDDIQYFYESRLPGEAAPVADRHVHPAEPRTLRVTWRAGF